MNFTLKVKKSKTNDLEKLKKHLMKLQKEKIEVGYFDGEIHQGSGMPLATLMALHESGVPSENIPSRPVFAIGYEELLPSRNKDTKLYIKNIVGQVGRMDNNVNILGEHYRDWLKAIFGDVGVLESNSQRTQAEKGRDDPLVDEGELRDNLGYRTTSNKTVKK